MIDTDTLFVDALFKLLVFLFKLLVFLFELLALFFELIDTLAEGFDRLLGFFQTAEEQHVGGRG